MIRSRFISRPWIVALLGVAYVLRVFYAAKVELLPEEAYYWNYARHLDIGYLDHPPLVAWVIRAGTAMFGDTPFGVRSGALACGALAAVFSFRLTRNLFGARCALSTLALFQVLPFFFLSGVLMTPDAPLTATWAASLYFLERALLGARARAWLFLGVTMGLGLLSKYTIALLGMAACLFMLLDVPSRVWFRRREPYLAVAIAAVLFLPVLVWNAEHSWASFVFQTARRLAEAPRFSLHKLLASALVLLTPVGLAAALLALVPGTGTGNDTRNGNGNGTGLGADADRGRRLLQCAVWVPLAVFALFSIRHEVKLDWTGAPWTAAVPLMSLGMVRAFQGAPNRGRWLRHAWPPTAGLMIALYALLAYHLAYGIPGVGDSAHIELLPVGWRELADQIDDVVASRRTGDQRPLLVIGMDRYAIASELAFYSSDQSRAVATTSSAHLFGDVGLMYEQWFPPRRQSGRDLLLVSWDRESLADAHLAAHVATLDPVVEGSLYRNGHLVRRFYYRFAGDYSYACRRGLGYTECAG